MCRSQAWDAKVVTSAWWVHPEQVRARDTAGGAGGQAEQAPGSSLCQHRLLPALLGPATPRSAEHALLLPVLILSAFSGLRSCDRCSRSRNRSPCPPTCLQVSKTAPTGEYLVTGSFMIRGRKNYLPPQVGAAPCVRQAVARTGSATGPQGSRTRLARAASGANSRSCQPCRAAILASHAPSAIPQPLVMGYGLMFGLAEESIPAHVGERAPRLREGEEPAAGVPTGPGAAENAWTGGCPAVAADSVQPPAGLLRLPCPTCACLDADGPAAAAGEGNDEDEEPEGDNGGEEEGPQGSSGVDAPAAPSALDAFLDASADTLAAGASSAPPVRRGSSTASAPGGAAADAVTAAFERYGLADTLTAAGPGAAAADEEEEAEAAGGEAGGGGGRRHLSAKERQLLKKQQQGKGAAPQGQQQQAGGGGGRKAQQQASKGGGGADQQAAAAPPAVPKGRGAGKGKKGRQDKYADQDEEDRQLAAALLQSAGEIQRGLVGAASPASPREGGSRQAPDCALAP